MKRKLSDPAPREEQTGTPPGMPVQTQGIPTLLQQPAPPPQHLAPQPQVLTGAVNDFIVALALSTPPTEQVVHTGDVVATNEQIPSAQPDVEMREPVNVTDQEQSPSPVESMENGDTDRGGEKKTEPAPGKHGVVVLDQNPREKVDIVVETSAHQKPESLPKSAAMLLSKPNSQVTLPDIKKAVEECQAFTPRPADAISTLLALRVVVSMSVRLRDKTDNVSAKDVSLAETADQLLQKVGRESFDQSAKATLTEVKGRLDSKLKRLDEICQLFNADAAKTIKGAMEQYSVTLGSRDYKSLYESRRQKEKGLINPELLTKIEDLLQVEQKLNENSLIDGEKAGEVLLLPGQLIGSLKNRDYVDQLPAYASRDKLTKINDDYLLAKAKQAALDLATRICGDIRKAGSLEKFLRTADQTYPGFFVHPLTAQWKGYLSANVSVAGYKEASGKTRVIFAPSGNEVYFTDAHNYATPSKIK